VISGKGENYCIKCMMDIRKLNNSNINSIVKISYNYK